MTPRRTVIVAIAGFLLAGLGSWVLLPHAGDSAIAQLTENRVEVPPSDAVMAIDDVVTTVTFVPSFTFMLDAETGLILEVEGTEPITAPVFNDDGTTKTVRRWILKPGSQLDPVTGRTFRRVTPTPRA